MRIVTERVLLVLGAGSLSVWTAWFAWRAHRTGTMTWPSGIASARREDTPRAFAVFVGMMLLGAFLWGAVAVGAAVFGV